MQAEAPASGRGAQPGARNAPPCGIVRPARRPAGWRAPGPPPAAPGDRPDLLPGPGEDLCFLAGDWRILQLVRGQRWSLDDLVWALAPEREGIAATIVEPPLVVRDARGRWSDEFRALRAAMGMPS